MRGETSSFRFGIEEEFFLADARTRGTPRSGLAKAFHSEVARRIPDAEREMLQSQIEISTPPGTDFAGARDRLAELRSGLAGVARENGLLVFAAGTHPVARWGRQAATPAERYERLMGELTHDGVSSGQLHGRRNGHHRRARSIR
jgi:carboxylate-amine ligase